MKDIRKHKAYLTPEEASGAGLVSNKKFAKWFLLPYSDSKGCHSNLQLDQMFPDDREELEFFLTVLYDEVAKALGISLKDCDFRHGGDLSTRCDCKLCKRLWGAFDANNVKLKCKHCGHFHWIRKDCYEENKEKYRKKLGKYNPRDYCSKCSVRLQIIDPKTKRNKRYF